MQGYVASRIAWDFGTCASKVWDVMVTEEYDDAFSWLICDAGMLFSGVRGVYVYAW